MKITDSIYGTFEITEPVLIELINSAPVRRLKGIEQVAILEGWPFPGFCRYEHELGIMLLVRKLNASLNEQIAALLHDVSHTAFSHIIDIVLGHKDEDYHDKIRDDVIRNSEIPSILKKYGIDPEDVDADKFPLIKAQAPDLSADRFDYAVREFKLWANPGIVQMCIDSLAVRDGRLVFTSRASADAFGRTLLRLQTEHWGGAESVLRYNAFAQAIKFAIDERALALDDFRKDDAHVLAKLRACKDPRIREILEKLSKKTPLAVDASRPVATKVKKFRYVDPEYVDGSAVKRLSEHDSSFRACLNEHQAINARGVVLNAI